MGTNYYLVKNGPSCREPIHIGKSSGGWRFSFQAQNKIWEDPPIVWNTYGQVKEVLKKLTVDSKEFAIVDEYDTVVSLDEFVRMVDAKQADERSRRNPDNFTYSRNVDGYRFQDGEFF